VNKLYCFVLLICAAKISLGQPLMLQGKIVFERRENMHKLIDAEMAAEKEPNTWWIEMRKVAPKYRVDLFELYFNTSQTLYKIRQEDEAPFNQRWFRVAHKNSVATNLKTNTYLTEKNVYERDYLLSDTLPRHQWKLTNEFREIAGKTCRKATTILFDSIYIIAFYTDEIPISGGPELFQGLPGMALGIVVPRIHMTYFATSIESQVINDEQLRFTPSIKKQRYISKADFEAEIKKAFKKWDDNLQKIYWRAMF
jgi:GLPGLI family protein